MVVGQVLHGQRVLAEGPLIFAVLPPDLLKVPHCRRNEREREAAEVDVSSPGNLKCYQCYLVYYHHHHHHHHHYYYYCNNW